MDHQTQVAIDAGMLSMLVQLVMMCPKSSIQRRQAWALSYMTMGPWLMAQLIPRVHSEVLEPLDNLLTIQDTKIVVILNTTWQRRFLRRQNYFLIELNRMDTLDVYNFGRIIKLARPL